MEKTTEQNKQVSNIKKRKRTITNIDFQLPPLPRRILFILLGVCALAFVIYQVASFGSSRVAKLHTQTAVSRTITRSITVDGIVVREESVLTANAAGTVVPRVENGSKVSAGDAVAEIFASPSTAQYLLELDDVQTQIAYYENIQSLSSGTIYENKDAYNQNIAHSLFELIGCIDRNELSALSDYVQDLSVSVTKKQTVIGKGVDVSARLSSLYRRRDALEGYISTGVTLPADRAGYYVD